MKDANGTSRFSLKYFAQYMLNKKVIDSKISFIISDLPAVPVWGSGQPGGPV